MTGRLTADASTVNAGASTVNAGASTVNSSARTVNSNVEDAGHGGVSAWCAALLRECLPFSERGQSVREDDRDEDEDDGDRELCGRRSRLSLTQSTTSQPGDRDDGGAASAGSSSSRKRRLSFPLRELGAARARVPLVSTTTLYNRLQTSGVVVVDCRRADEFAAARLPGALLCPPVHRWRRGRSVDGVLAHMQNPALVQKLLGRDLLELVVIGGNRSSNPLLYRLDWGYRFAKLLVQEGRVFSVRFLAQGFPAFAAKYPFMLLESPMAEPDFDSSGGPPAKLGPFPNEIVDDFLFLGNFWQADSPAVVRALRVTHIVNMGAMDSQRNRFPGVEYLDVAVADKADVDIRREFEPTLAFIERAAGQRGARVLIHCVQGVSRSSTIAIMYIMRRTRCTLSAAYAHVLKCRPLIFPNRGFMAQLMANERELYGAASVTEEDLDALQSGLLPAVDRRGSALHQTFL